MQYNTSQYLWEQKYRPNSVDELVLPSKLKKLFLKMVEKGESQNMIFHSQVSGTGKSSTAMALVYDFGETPLFINGSLKRGIDAIRGEVLDFVQSGSLSGGMKYIIIDECDRLTIEAQESLKGVIESVSASARFIFTANNITGVTDHLKSRCVMIDFSHSLSKKQKKNLLKSMILSVERILDNEDIDYNELALAKFVSENYPDMRKTINRIQSYALGSDIIDEGIFTLSDTNVLKFAIKNLKSGSFKGLKEWSYLHSYPLGERVYTLLFDALMDVVYDETKPVLVTILDEQQKTHRSVPDLNIHILSTLIEIKRNCKFIK